ncbi:MAG: DUF4430 domain-containing protein [Eubacteriales bacterium]
MKKRNSFIRICALALVLCLALAFVSCGGGIDRLRADEIARLDVYSEADYTPEDWARLSEIYQNAVDEIESLKNKKDIEAFDHEKVNDEMSKIKTGAQRAAEAKEEAEKALAEAKAAKIAALNNYNKADYRDAEWKALTDIIEKAKAEINALTDKAAVDKFDTAAVNAEAAKIKTDAELLAEEKAAATKALEDAKAAKIAALRTYHKDDYRDAEWKALTDIIEKAKAEINALTDKAAVDKFDTAAVNAEAAKIKTDAELLAEEKAAATKALEDTKAAKIAALRTYSKADYRTAEWEALTDIIEKAKAEINALTDKAAVEAYDTDAVNAATAAIKTDAELTAEEKAAEEKALAEAKAAKIAALRTYDKADYRDAEWKALTDIIEKAKAEINALTDKAAVEAYDTDAVNAATAAIKTDDELTAEEEAARPAPSIKTSLDDGKTYSGKTLTIDVFARNWQNAKIASKVTLNGTDVAVNWDDAEKTSFTLNFTDGENVVTITATDGKKTTTVTYHVQYVKAAPSFVFSVDAFTIGCGYIVEPTVVTLDDATIDAIASYCAEEHKCDAEYVKAHLNTAHVLLYLLNEYGYTAEYNGKPDQSFYLSYVNGFDNSDNIPDNLREKLESNGFSISDDSDDSLGEFMYTWGSGWMYCVDGVFPNVGFADHYIQDGEVIRVQFTLAYGSDIGGSSAMGMGGTSDYFENAGEARDRLTKAMALAAQKRKDNTKEYSAAFDVISQFGITAAELDAATEALMAILK